MPSLKTISGITLLPPHPYRFNKRFSLERAAIDAERTRALRPNLNNHYAINANNPFSQKLTDFQSDEHKEPIFDRDKWRKRDFGNYVSFLINDDNHSCAINIYGSAGKIEIWYSWLEISLFWNSLRTSRFEMGLFRSLVLVKGMVKIKGC